MPMNASRENLTRIRDRLEDVDKEASEALELLINLVYGTQQSFIDVEPKEKYL